MNWRWRLRNWRLRLQRRGPIKLGPDVLGGIALLAIVGAIGAATMLQGKPPQPPRVPSYAEVAARVDRPGYHDPACVAYRAQMQAEIDLLPAFEVRPQEIVPNSGMAIMRKYFSVTNRGPEWDQPPFGHLFIQFQGYRGVRRIGEAVPPRFGGHMLYLTDYTFPSRAFYEFEQEGSPPNTAMGANYRKLVEGLNQIFPEQQDAPFRVVLGVNDLSLMPYLRSSLRVEIDPVAELFSVRAELTPAAPGSDRVIATLGCLFDTAGGAQGVPAGRSVVMLHRRLTRTFDHEAIEIVKDAFRPAMIISYDVDKNGGHVWADISKVTSEATCIAQRLDLWSKTWTSGNGKSGYLPCDPKLLLGETP